MSGLIEMVASGALGAGAGVVVQYLRTRSTSRRAQADEATAAATVEVARVEAEVRVSEALMGRLAATEDRIDRQDGEIKVLREHVEECERGRREDRAECDRARAADRRVYEEKIVALRADLATMARRVEEHRVRVTHPDDTGVHELRAIALRSTPPELPAPRRREEDRDR